MNAVFLCCYCINVKIPTLSMLWIVAMEQFKRLLQKITLGVGNFVLIFILPKKNRSGRIISAIDKQKL